MGTEEESQSGVKPLSVESMISRLQESPKKVPMQIGVSENSGN